MRHEPSRKFAALAVAGSAAVLLASCGGSDGGTSSERSSNPATPPEDKARAAAVNGYDAKGEPIDAVAAATMDEKDLPPLKSGG